jgi:hypothetical protein
MPATLCRVAFVVALTLLPLSSLADDYTVERWIGPPAGRGTYDGIGAKAQLDQPNQIARDGAGNVYFINELTGSVRKLDPAGEVTTLAGPNFIDANGQYREFTFTGSVAADVNGFVYLTGVLDKIFRISPQGLVSEFVTIPGAGVLAIDSVGNLYASSTDKTISRITPNGVRTVIAGMSNQPGTEDGAGSAARFVGVRSIAFDREGDLLIVDGEGSNCSLRKVTKAGVVTTITNALGWAYSAVIDDANVAYVSVEFPPRILKVVNGTISAWAGSSVRLHRDGTGSGAAFGSPRGMVRDASGNIYLADRDAAAIRKITPEAVVSTVEGGTQAGSIDGDRASARLLLPTDVAIDTLGNAFVTELYAIRKVTPSGDVTTFAGNANESGTADGPGPNARFSGLRSIVAGTDDMLYVIDSNQIRRITADGDVSTLVGTPTPFHYATALTISPDGTLYVADYNGHVIWRVSPAGVVSKVAGMAGVAASTDGTGSAARFAFPEGIALDASGSLLVTERKTVRKITFPDAVVTTVAGDATSPADHIDGTGAAARLRSPRDIVVLTDGTAVFNDLNTLRMLTAGGVVTTVAGDRYLQGRVSGTGSNARLFAPSTVGLGVNAANHVYAVEIQNQALSIAKPAGIADIATATVTSNEIQLNTDGEDATAWEWRIVRRPSAATAELSDAGIRNPTLVRDSSDFYTFLLRAEGPLGVRYSLVEVPPVTPSCNAIASAVASVNGGTETTICPPATGDTVSVAVSGGGTLGYQWGWRDTPSGAIHPIAGATNSSYVLQSSDLGDYGTKYVTATITPTCGAPVVSNNVQVIVQGASITAPAEVIGSATYTVSVDDPSDPATFQWSIVNGTILSGATSRTVTFRAGESGSATLSVDVTKDSCTRTVEEIIPIVERAENATLFYVVTACRIVDSRATGGQLLHQQTRTIDIAGVCGIPAGAKAIAVNLTAVNPTVTGFLALYPSNVEWGGTSMLNYRANKTRATAGIVPLSPDGQLTVLNNGAAQHFIIDVTGYFE